jgi:Zn ribbon nucleic-acid-binding protein
MSGRPGPAAPPSPWRDDTVTIRACPACGQPFAPSGRRRWCSDACKQAAYRRRATPVPAPALPAGRPKRQVTVYECSSCGHRALGTQRCDDCGTFMSAAGIGGLCPHCEEPVTIQDLIAGHNP